MLFLPLSYSIYLHMNDVVVFLKTIIVFICVAQNIIQTVICFVKYYLLQVSFSQINIWPCIYKKIWYKKLIFELRIVQYIIEEMKICIKESQEYEIKIFQKYIAKLKTVWGCSIICMYFYIWPLWHLWLNLYSCQLLFHAMQNIRFNLITHPCLPSYISINLFLAINISHICA